MAEDIQNYILQLQQVEAALLSDPDNPELLKLKTDLEEVIELSKDLTAQAADNSTNDGLPSSSNHADRFSNFEKLDASNNLLQTNKPLYPWKIGDKCYAKWSDDGQYYEATIDNISSDGQVNVTFEAYKNRGVTLLTDLKEMGDTNSDGETGKSSKMGKVNQREYLKKKKLKKQQRFKELEEVRELEKKKWLAFTNKKSKKGHKVKSIFASPDTVNGRVGIGTCGMSGKPMTEFTAAEKWRKGV